MEKSPEAFRTISEVADWLGVPTHVLRFWESRFTQIKPVKRAGGRRYYRPSDMALIGGIKRLLHDDGMTIRGAQKLLREKGVKHVAALSQALDGQAADVDDDDTIEATAIELTKPAAPPAEKAPKKTPDPAEAATPPEAEPVVVPDPEPELAPQPPPTQAPVPSDPPALESTPDPAPSETPEPVSAENVPSGEPAMEPAPPQAAAAAIALPDDVPQTDPGDDDAAYPATPGLAMRLRAADPAYLRRNRDALRLVAERTAARASA